MANLDYINQQINEMRQVLHNLINEKTSLLDEEVIAASQRLDDILDEYNNELIRQEKSLQEDKKISFVINNM